MNEITITLPLPDKVLSPNGRTHWASKARATKTARQMAWLAASAGLASRKEYAPQWERAEVRAVFFHPDRRRRDMDNLAASCKAYFDGFADAGVIANDSGLIHYPPEMRVDKARPRVEITIKEAA